MQFQSSKPGEQVSQLLAQADTLLSFDFAEGVLIYDYPRAVNVSERALTLAREANDQKLLSAALSLRAKVHWFNGEYPSSISLYRESLSSRKLLRDTAGIADNFMRIGLNYYYSSDFDSAIYYYTKALNTSEGLGDPRSRRRLLNHIALVYYKKSEYKEVIHYTQLAGRMEFSEAADPVIEIDVPKNVYRDDVYYHSVLNEQLDLLRLERERQRNSRAVILILRNIAFTYQLLKQHDSTLFYFQLAHKAAKKIGVIPYLMDHGNAFRAAGKPDSALCYYKYAADESSKRGTRIHYYWAHQMMSEAFRELNQYDSALHHGVISLQSNIKMNNRHSVASDYFRIASIYLAQKNTNKAFENAKLGLSLSRQIGTKALSRDFYKLFSEIYESQRDYDNSHRCLKEFNALSDSIASGESDLSLAELQIAYEVEKQKNEIQNLNSANRVKEAQLRNTEILVTSGTLGLIMMTAIAGLVYVAYKNKKIANRKLEQGNREKDLLLGEIHHRVKNNLQIISSLINLKSHGTSGETQDLLFQLNGRILSMGLIHDRLYNSNNIQSIRVDEYLIELAQTLVSSASTANSVALRFDVDPITVDVEFALTFGLICNELITNSIKYAFYENQPTKEISLSLRATEKELQLNFADNGNSKKKGPTVPAKAFGLRFVDQLVSGRLMGKWKYSLDDGFKAHIVVPVLQPKKSQWTRFK